MLDDELGEAFAKILENEKTFLWFISDSCHSGTLSRGDAELALELGQFLTDEQLLRISQASKRRGAVSDELGEGLPQSSARFVAFYSSASSQPSKQGVFTKSLCQNLRRLKSNTSFKVLFDNVSQLRAGAQRPLIEGAGENRAVFGGDASTRLTDFRFSVSFKYDQFFQKTDCFIEGGILDFITSGARVKLWCGEQEIGLAEVESAGALESEVKLISELDGFAVRSSDIEKTSREKPKELELVETPVQGRLGAGKCVRVKKANEFPLGATEFVPVQHCKIDGDKIKVITNDGIAGQIFDFDFDSFRNRIFLDVETVPSQWLSLIHISEPTRPY